MLLCIDAGNTNITVGVFDDGEMKGPYRMTTRADRTSDEYGVLLMDILEYNGVNPAAVEDCILASVVPKINHSLINGIYKYFEIQPLLVEAGIKTGIKIVTENPKQIGADRIVDAAAVYEIYGGPCLVVDYGTATTYDLVGSDGSFEAAVTAPGIRISASALWQGAAKLPEVELVKPRSILAKETISSMQAGLIFGQIGQTEYIVREMIRESGYENVRVIATGGLGSMIAKETDAIDIYDPNLTLRGLKIIYQKQRGRIRSRKQN